MEDRDLVGYGAHPPDVEWPDAARVAVQFVLNVEEGAERVRSSNGDDESESYLHELPGRPSRDRRSGISSVEGMYEYGSRAGVWRILRSRLLLAAAAADRLRRRAGRWSCTPDIGRALGACRARGRRATATGGSTIVTFGEEEERRHIQPHRRGHPIEIVRTSGRSAGTPGRVSAQYAPSGTRGGRVPLQRPMPTTTTFPYWLARSPCPRLVIPYTLVTNDARYLLPTGPSLRRGILRTS